MVSDMRAIMILCATFAFAPAHARDIQPPPPMVTNPPFQPDPGVLLRFRNDVRRQDALEERRRQDARPQVGRPVPCSPDWIICQHRNR